MGTLAGLGVVSTRGLAVTTLADMASVFEGRPAGQLAIVREAAISAKELLVIERKAVEDYFEKSNPVDIAKHIEDWLNGVLRRVGVSYW